MGPLNSLKIKKAGHKTGFFRIKLNLFGQHHLLYSRE